MADNRHGPAGGGGLAGATLAWLAWWVLCGALWLVLVDNTHRQELALGGAGPARAARGGRRPAGTAMNVWLAAALILLAAMLPLGAVCFFARRAIDGLVALDLAGTNAALALLLLSEGLKRQPFADLALVAAA